MLNKIIAVFTVCLASCAVVVAQVKMPSPSPKQIIKQEFGIGSIEVMYSRPAAKGRKVFGDLVPYGKLWRTGANEATQIIITEPLEIGGRKLDTGTYVIYTIPGTESWEIILNKGLRNWGTDGYKESEDVVRFKIVPVKLKEHVESFTIQIAAVKPESCALQLLWEKTMISIPVIASYKDKLRQQLEAALQSEKKPYWQAAQFYTEYDKNLPKALEYATKAYEENPSAYWVLLYKANIQKDMGDVAGAIASAQKSLALAKAAGNADYVRMNEKLIKELKQQQ
jgi:hypothetical protein